MRKFFQIVTMSFILITLSIFHLSGVNPSCNLRRIKFTTFPPCIDTKDLRPQNFGERTVYFDSDGNPQLTYNHKGEITEEYFYDNQGKLSYVMVKNLTNHTWIKLQSIDKNPPSDRDVWGIYLKDKCIGGITLIIDRENNSLYIGRIDIVERNRGIGKTVLNFLYNYYKMLPQYSDLRSLSAHTHNPALAEIFFQLSNQKEIHVGEERKTFPRENLTQLVKYIIKSTGIGVKFQLPNGESKSFKINTAGYVEYSDIPELEGKYVFGNIEVKRDEFNRWTIFISSKNYGILDAFVSPIRIESDLDY